MSWSDVDWGSVPQWLSAVSVPAALYIIYRDGRQKDMSQAALVTAWVETDDRFAEKPVRTLFVQNASNQAIVEVRLGYPSTRPGIFKVYSHPIDRGALKAGETKQETLDGSDRNRDLHIYFKDARKVTWAYNIRMGTTARVSTKMRISMNPSGLNAP